MKNTIYLLVFLFSLTLLSCGGGKNDTGSASFGLSFEQTSAASEIKPAPSAASAVDICASYGIDFISGTVYNSSNTVIATGGPWACSAHQGTITNIPAGSNLKIEIKGTVASSVVWQGETTGITVTADHDTDVGTVTMTYIGSDTTPPTISSFTPSDSDTNVPVTTVITATFSENISEPTINTDTFTLYDNSAEGYVNGAVTYDSSTKTAIFTPSGNLSYSSNYTAEIMQGTLGVQDLAGWMLQGTSKWNFITEAVPTSAPSVPTGVSATNGDAQVTISWSAVSGATSYNIYWSNSTGVTKINGTKITGATSPYIHTTLSNGTTYYYVVTAVNGYGESVASSQALATPDATPSTSAPSAPSDVSASTGDARVTISWTAVSGATSYNIYWSTISGVTKSNGTLITGVTNPYIHTGRTNGTTYYYVVTAVNSYGVSVASSQVSATPNIASGSLDTTFGTGGKVTTTFGMTDAASAIAIQSDGKIVAVGYSNNGSNSDFAIARYNTDGTLDSTFGTGGQVTTAIGSSDDVAYALGIQSDGKIVAAGYSNNGSNDDFAVVRYNTDGTLDSTFGTGGQVTTAIGSSDDVAYALCIQSDGRILAAGSLPNGAWSSIALARYNTDGSLDTTFGTGGKVTSVGWDYAYALGIQSDGKIVAAGYSTNDGSSFDFAVVRYNTDGTLDTTFGTGGKVTTSIGKWDYAYALGIQSDGKIVAAGSSDNDFAVVRYNTDGTLDTSFGTGGQVTTDIGSGPDSAHTLGIQSDGKIVVAGTSDNNEALNNFFAIARYNTDGTLDATFGTGGKVTTDIGGYNDAAYALGIQSDGKIVAAGRSSDDFAVVRYLP